MKHLWKRLGPAFRRDCRKIVKGAFGLGQSPRHYHLKLKEVLTNLGFRELRLVKCVFVYVKDQTLCAIVMVHVDDLLCAASAVGETVLKKLRKIFTFGDWKGVMDGWVRFCGREYLQLPDYTFRISLKFYAAEIRLIKIDPDRDLDLPCNEKEVAELMKVNGQNC